MSGDPVQAKVELMAKVFVGRLPVRFEKMNEALALCRASPQDPANWIELHRLLHSLAGAAGTFGCDALGAHAARIEQRIKQLLALPDRSPTHLDEIGHALASLQSST
jgi:HPt (histidine-containing phosphotransfer) domain-containing protein